MGLHKSFESVRLTALLVPAHCRPLPAAEPWPQRRWRPSGQVDWVLLCQGCQDVYMSLKLNGLKSFLWETICHMPFFGVEKADSRAPLSFQPAWSKLRTHHVSRISELLVQFLCFCHRKRLGLCLIAGPQLTFEASAGEESCVTRRALDQSSRYADLSLDEDTLIRNGSSLRDSLSKGRQCHACHARQVSFSCLFSFFFQCFFEPSL